MQKGRHGMEGRKQTAIIPEFMRGGRAGARLPGLRLAGGIFAILALILMPAGASAQSPAAKEAKAAGASKISDAQLLTALASAPGAQQPRAGTNANSNNAPLTLTLHDALQRAEKYSPQFQAAVTAAKMARANVTQARATLLPSVDATAQELLTQGNGIVPSGRYVTNDGVHVYRAWGVFRQTISADTFTLAGYRAATAAEDMARAQQEIAQRGLNVVVTQAYYALVVAERGYGTAQ